jgi:hypothetical protein
MLSAITDVRFLHVIKLFTHEYNIGSFPQGVASIISVFTIFHIKGLSINCLFVKLFS